eukprot:4787384-Amphidinium_carterae.1
MESKSRTECTCSQWRGLGFAATKGVGLVAVLYFQCGEEDSSSLANAVPCNDVTSLHEVLWIGSQLDFYPTCGDYLPSCVAERCDHDTIHLGLGYPAIIVGEDAASSQACHRKKTNVLLEPSLHILQAKQT